MNQKQLGRFLRKKREALCVTQGELARKLGFSSSQFISNIERGVSVIPFSRIKEYADNIGLDGTELSGLVSEAINDKTIKKTAGKLNVGQQKQDPFIEAFTCAWRTASQKEKDCVKIVAERVLNIDYTE